MDVMTEFGMAGEIHVIAARRIFEDAVKQAVGRQELIQNAKRIEKSSPVAGMLLCKWVEDYKKSCEGLKPEEIPDTDDEF